MFILTLTCWKYAIKYALFASDSLTAAATGSVERVEVGGTHLGMAVPGREHYSLESECADHRAALALILESLTSPEFGVVRSRQEIVAVGHRVVHGGAEFDRSVLIDARVHASIRAFETLAPLHNVPNNRGLEAAMELLPHIPHVAVFDTAFHQTLPEHAYIYPLPYSWFEQYGVRRYGFHGPSHLYLSRRAAALLGKAASECNVITVHVENGMSICAVKGGVSIDTSMGFTPLEGLVMGTRSGDIDPGIPPYIMAKLNITAQEFDTILNQKSGCAGVVGRNVGRQRLLDAAIDGDRRCMLALELQSYRLKKYIGAYLAIAGPVDAIVFSAGSGGDEWVAREQCLDGLENMGVVADLQRNRNIHDSRDTAEISQPDSTVKIFVIPTAEDLVIVEDVRAILGGNYQTHQERVYSFAHTGFNAQGRS